MKIDGTIPIKRKTHSSAENTALPEQARIAPRRQGETLRGGPGPGMLTTLLRSFPNGSVNVLDRDLRYRFADGQGLAKVGLSADSLIGKRLADIYPAEQVALVTPYYRRALAGEEVTFDLPVFGNVYSIHASPLREPDGSIRSIITVALDITNRRRTEAALRESEAALRESEAALRASESALRASEARLNGILGALKDVVWSVSAADFRLLYVNDAVEEVFQRPAAAFFADPQLWFTVTHPDDQPTSAAALAGLLATGSMEREIRIVRPSGEVRWLHDRAVLSRDEATDTPLRIDGIATDITERKQAEQERERLAGIVESSEDAIVSKSLEGIILSWNGGAQQLYGYHADEVIGKSVSLLVPPDAPDDLPSILESLRAGRKIVHHETVRVRRDGQRFVVSQSISPTRNAAGELVGIAVISRDITETKAARDALRKSEEQFRALAQNSPDLIARYDTDGRYRYVNPAMERAARRPASAFLQRTHEETGLSAGAITKWKSVFDAAKRTGEVEEVSYSSSASGAVKHYNSRFVPEFGPDGKTIVSLLGVTRDVTETKNAADELLRQKALLESQTEASLDGILTVSPDGRIIGCNRRFGQMWGIGDVSLQNHPDAPILQRVTSLVAEPETFLRRVEYLYAHQDEESFDRIPLKDGRIFARHSTPAKGADGAHYGRIWFFRDVTERERMEATLRASEERFRALTENSSDVIGVHAPDGTVLYQSPSTEAVFGYAPSELVGTSGLALIHPEDLPAVLDAMGRLVAEKDRSDRLSYRCRHKDGSWRWVETVGSNQVDNPAIGGFVTNARDVTERKRLEQQVIHTEKLAALGELVAGVAHEINNPLAAISGHAQLLMMRSEREIQADATIIVEMVRRASRIIRSLCSYARSDNADHRSYADLNAVVHAALVVVAYRLRKAGVELSLDLADDLPLLLMNAGGIEQVIVNLLANAEQALRDRPADARFIAITTRREPRSAGTSAEDAADGQADAAVLTIRDTGMGMPESVRTRIFDPFFTTKDTGEGTGLGLYISHGIVVAHGGTIAVESEVGQGTTFTITLPLV